MQIYLTEKQADKLSDFFIDIAKGLVLGGIGLLTTTREESKITIFIVSILLAIWFIKIALDILQEKKYDTN